MGFFEFVFLFSLTVFLPLVIVKMTMDHKRQKLEIRKAEVQTQGGLTIGELKQLLREVVEEANEPLAERVASLERQLPPASIDVPEHESEGGRTIGRRAASEPLR